jgi:hypothetical protein
MRPPRLTALTTLLLLVGLPSAGCDPGLIVDDWPDVRIRGTVHDHAGAPVGDAHVRAEVREIGCTSAVWTVFEARADAGGRFRAAYEDPRGVFSGCLAIRVTPSPSSALPVTTLTLDSVFGTRRGHDYEVELTLVLPAPDP